MARTSIYRDMDPSIPLIHRIYSRIFKIWRVKRFRMFRETLKPRRADRLLDVGGYPASWVTHEPVVGSIDSLNIHEVSWNPDRAPEHHIRVLIGNGCDLQMSDRSYDIAFSNSVIEHVGSWENQVAFASEIRRVGRALWIQTPARGCPVEPHYLALFVHWLPKGIQKKIMRYGTLWGWIARPSRKEIDEMVETTRLISKKEMKVLFPDCQIHTERLLGILPKSYVAYRLHL